MGSPILGSSHIFLFAHDNFTQRAFCGTIILLFKTGKREKRLGKNQGRLKVGCGVV